MEFPIIILRATQISILYWHMYIMRTYISLVHIVQIIGHIFMLITIIHKLWHHTHSFMPWTAIEENELCDIKRIKLRSNFSHKFILGNIKMRKYSKHIKYVYKCMSLRARSNVQYGFFVHGRLWTCSEFLCVFSHFQIFHSGIMYCYLNMMIIL